MMAPCRNSQHRHIAICKLLVATLLLLHYAQSNPLPQSDAAAPPPLPNGLADSSKLACRPAGECQMCPEDMRNDPVCRVHGNRRPVHCIVLDEASIPKQQKHGAPPPMPKSGSNDDFNNAGNRPFGNFKRPPKHPIVELPPRPGVHPDLLEHKGDYIVDDQSGQKPDGEGPVKRAEISRADIQQIFATWEPCERAIDAERKDFWEFILCNLAFATVALSVVIVRGRMIAARHYNQLVGLVGFKPLQQLFQAPSQSNGNAVSSSRSGPSNV